jgi:hypothetical protein
MTSDDLKDQKRIVWLTPDQRSALGEQVVNAISKMDADDERHEVLSQVQKELDGVSRRERISGRLVTNHVTGLMLPHDALPVRVTDGQADVLLGLGIKDKRTKRLLRPGPRKQGRR